jgi:hypothetical protein
MNEDNACFTLTVKPNAMYNIQIHETRIEDLDEKTIDFDEFTQALGSIDYKLVESKRLIPEYNALLSENEIKLSSFYTYFVFHKK